MSLSAVAGSTTKPFGTGKPARTAAVSASQGVPSASAIHLRDSIIDLDYTAVVRNTEFQRTIYTVSQLSFEIREMLERRFVDIWVEGEISNFKTSTAGHLYFTLKDERAQIAAVCFRNN